MRSGTLMLTVLAGLLAACGGSSPATGGPQATATPGTQAQATPNQPAATPNNQPTVNAVTGATIAHLEVGGGPQAGTYDATGEKLDCNVSSTGSGATYLDINKSTGLSGLTFSAGEGGANLTRFYFQASFGALTLSQVTLEIQTLVPGSEQGHGTAQMEDKGATIRWTIDGATADGVTIKASIECGPVDRR
jgi:hypothetical protein